MKSRCWNMNHRAWLVLGLGLLVFSTGCLREPGSRRQRGAALATYGPAPVESPVQMSQAYRQKVDQQLDAATSQVVASCASQQAFTRANAMEACEFIEPERRLPMLQLGVQDVHPAVRFSALTVAGRLKMQELIPTASRLRHDADPSVRGSAIFMLHQCGQSVDLTPIGAMLFDKRSGVRANGAMLLSLIGDPGAIPMLKESARISTPKMASVQEAIVRVQIAEAIGKLGDDTILDAVRAAGFSQFDEVRILAVTTMGELGDRRFEAAMQQMMSEPPIELQIAAAQSLAGFGRHDGLELVMRASMMEIPTVRGQAAMALGRFADPRAAARLSDMLADSQETVRLSAAAAMLRARARLVP